MDRPQTITAQLQIVRHNTRTNISQIKSGLLVIRVTRVGVRDIHIREGEAIEQVPAIVANIVQDHSFSLVETNTEGPLLPVYDIGSALLGDGEAGAFGLHHVQRLEVCSQLLILWHIFVAGPWDPWLRLADGVVLACRETIDANDLEFLGDNRGYGQWQSVVVRVRIVAICGVSEV